MTVGYQLSMSLENEYLKTSSRADKLRILVEIASTRYFCLLKPVGQLLVSLDNGGALIFEVQV